jgi:DNA-binding FadR family transcriptional regulator
MKPTDLKAENSDETIGRSLRRRPLARKKLSDMVEEELEQMIRRKEFAQGEQLPSERELMEFFNVGRPSVREALAALKRKGLVQINNGERARVSMPSADTIIGELSGMAKDFLTQPGGIAHFEQLRLFFESSLVRFAAEYATDEQIAQLTKRWRSTASRWMTTPCLSVPTSIFTACWRKSPAIRSLMRSTLRCSTG